jgi:D-arabinose 1-dehydrogenase-like Zn-dependent alcohol dehydrogenase
LEGRKERNIMAPAAAATEEEVDAWAARDTSGHLSPFTFSRRATRPGDVKLKVLFCGVCHSDLHQIHNDWGGSIYPMVPGHEIVGEVTEVGSEVKAFKVGEIVGVGCMVNSCQTCDPCTQHLEQYCQTKVWTYNDKDYDGTITQGGYSTIMICRQEFVLKIPTNLPLDAAAPLLCAGITVYSPMKHFQMDVAGKHFGVVGLGGLGHMAVKFGKAFGMMVTVFSTSPSKEKEACELLGADRFIVSKDPEQMKVQKEKKND